VGAGARLPRVAPDMAQGAEGAPGGGRKRGRGMGWGRGWGDRDVGHLCRPDA